MVYETYLYDLLAVTPQASGDEICKAYKKLALKYHPDKTNHDPDLTEKFKEATQAYEVLKEPRTRRVYDVYGPGGLDGSVAAKQEQQRRAPPQRFPFQQDLFSHMFNEMSSAFQGSPFEEHFGLFGSSMNAAGSNMNMGFDMNMNMNMNTPGRSKRVVRPAPADPRIHSLQQGPDIQHTFKVSLADMYYGRSAKFQLPRKAKCGTCNGIGGLNPQTCRQYEGRNIKPGDVVIHLQELPHPSLIRRNNDLFLEQDIDLKTALVGGTVLVHDFINPGEELKIFINVHGNDAMNDSVNAAIKCGEVVGSINSNTPKIVKGMGMPINLSIRNGKYYQKSDLETDSSDFTRGDLYIRFNVQIPSIDQFASIEDIAQLSKILPGKPAEHPGKTATHEHNLSNLPGPEPMLKQSPEEYDYDQIEVDSQGSREEEQDDIFYMGEWSKEAERKKKRRVNG
ncbi:hypothetical protein CA3LBN_001489 [Candidozyma haemuli]|uniref:J domain-containing protein n=1 Tax=Candidozyma haemuli TaxID=45357 RepID=A0ABX8I2A3_9ASCO|nr:hypothetical protein CA3LBN_001489 [[Candida] haemuloni]